MKRKIIILFFLLSAFATMQSVQAQSPSVIIPTGHGEITVTKEGSKLPKTYVFTEKDPATYNCAENGEGQSKFTEITMANDFEMANKTELDINVHISITPSGVGTFILNSEKNTRGNIIIDFDNVKGPNLMSFPNDGTNGSVTITNYPTVGGDVTGTFKARLLDQSDKKSGYYDVSGSFSVRRVQ